MNRQKQPVLPMAPPVAMQFQDKRFHQRVMGKKKW